jgi:hypothetical protein
VCACVSAAPPVGQHFAPPSQAGTAPHTSAGESPSGGEETTRAQGVSSHTAPCTIERIVTIDQRLHARLSSRDITAPLPPHMPQGVRVRFRKPSAALPLSSPFSSTVLASPRGASITVATTVFRRHRRASSARREPVAQGVAGRRVGTHALAALQTAEHVMRPRRL